MAHAVALDKSELARDVATVRLVHTFKVDLGEFHALRLEYHGRTVQAPRHVRRVKPYGALEGHERIPLGHGGLLAEGYQRVDGAWRETLRRVVFGVYGYLHVGMADVIVKLVLHTEVYQLHDNVDGSVQLL